MKKLILLFSLFIVITACSSDNNDNSEKNNTSKGSFNPPAWLIGSWKSDFAVYTFTKDDIIVTAGGTRLSFKDQTIVLKNAGSNYSIKETNTSDNYTAEYSVSVTTTILSFTKLPNNQISADGYLKGLYTKQ